MGNAKLQQPTAFKVEFWTEASGLPRKHRNRYYSSVEGMIRAGARWEAKGSDYWCRYWNGLNMWTSATKTRVDGSLTGSKVLPKPLQRTTRGKRTGMQIFSVFGVCEVAAAEIMLKDGRATRKIPANEIPDSALFNKFGDKAKFAVMVPSNQVIAFNELIKDLRA